MVRAIKDRQNHREPEPKDLIITLYLVKKKGTGRRRDKAERGEN